MIEENPDRETFLDVSLFDFIGNLSRPSLSVPDILQKKPYIVCKYDSIPSFAIIEAKKGKGER